jgi:hypothetical protein
MRLHYCYPLAGRSKHVATTVTRSKRCSDPYYCGHLANLRVNIQVRFRIRDVNEFQSYHRREENRMATGK